MTTVYQCQLIFLLLQPSCTLFCTPSCNPQAGILIIFFLLLPTSTVNLPHRHGISRRHQTKLHSSPLLQGGGYCFFHGKESALQTTPCAIALRRRKIRAQSRRHLAVQEKKKMCRATYLDEYAYFSQKHT